MRGALAFAILVGAVTACSAPAGKTYYERTIQPILIQNCARGTSGCHEANFDDPYKFAAGNLDVCGEDAPSHCVDSFNSIQKRRDLLQPFGAYPLPLLLIKAVAPAFPTGSGLQLPYNGNFIDIQVTHAGGAIITADSNAFYTLQQWMENGATANGLKPPTPPQKSNVPCSTAVPSGFDPTPYTSNPNFAAFQNNVQPILNAHNCVSGNCHGAPQSDFYITCGSDQTQLAFNFSEAWAFVNNPVDDSQILRIPLAVSAGGRGHTGGDQFSSTTDGDYTAIRTWAQAVGPLDFAMGDAKKQFFATYVQPIFLQRGCMFEACHSPMATNDFKLRSGTQGFFSAISLQRNYDLLKNNFMALEFPDARRGRAVAKTINPADYRDTTVGGIAHRGGPVLDTPGAPPSDPANCPAVWSATDPPFCTIQHWVDLERAALGTQVAPLGSGDAANIVYVERTAATTDRLQFDTFVGNGDLRVAHATYGAGQTVQPVDVATNSTSLIGGCAGTTPGAVDVQAPDVDFTGTRVAFAMRRNAGEPLTIWTVNIDGSGCAQLLAALPDSNGQKVHDFDPAWSPDGAYIVFASTRGKSGVGATLSRKRFLPQSDIWRVHLADKTVEQVTVLSNSEISPQFMREGRITMTTEKTSDGFYQLAGRRINWDLTDYHPLLAQRQTSPYADLADLTQTKPSIGYAAATDIREANDGNFLVILSDVGADGKPTLPGAAGALATFNRSIGPFENGRSDPGFLPSVRVLGDPGATGHTGATAGYRAPFYLPDGQIMASFASNVGAANFTIVSVDPRTGANTQLFTNGGGKVQVDAVLAYPYPARSLYLNRRQLVFGGSSSTADPQHAILHMPDAPMVFTLLTGNLRRGRPVDAFRKATQLVVLQENGCPMTGGCSANTNGIYQSRTMLGAASLASDGSVRVRLPSATGVILQLADGSGNTVVTMTEEHQLGPGESISMGISQTLFDSVCGGCHGSVTGQELDIAVTADALTGASASMSANSGPATIGP
jgi:hypothetical protein